MTNRQLTEITQWVRLGRARLPELADALDGASLLAQELLHTRQNLHLLAEGIRDVANGSAPLSSIEPLAAACRLYLAAATKP